MKINLGSGRKRYPGFLNVDDPNTNPDYVVNLETDKLPFEDNSISEVKAQHIFEHINNFIPLVQEIYRVCKHGAILDIEAPHHFANGQYSDPTHVRFITVDGMRLFDRKFNQLIIDHGSDSSSCLSIKYNIDFELVWYDFRYNTFYQDMLSNYKQRKDRGEVSQEEDFMVTRLLQEANNVAADVMIKMKVIKE